MNNLNKLINEGAPCPICSQDKLTIVKKDIDFKYKGFITKLSKEVLECQVCKESFFKSNEERKIEKYLTNERRKVDGLLTTDEIKAIRKKFNFTQVEFAKLLRVGEKNFARYESGQTNQGVAVDNLLRVLNDYPEAINTFKKVPRKNSNANFESATV